MPRNTLATTLVRVLADIRCHRCSKLLFRWHPKGISVINVKCTRCGFIDTMQLST